MAVTSIITRSDIFLFVYGCCVVRRCMYAVGFLHMWYNSLSPGFSFSLSCFNKQCCLVVVVG